MKRKHTIIIIFVIFWILIFAVPAILGDGDFANSPGQKQIIIEVQPTTQPQIQPNASNVALDWAKVLIPALVAVAVVAVPIWIRRKKLRKAKQ